MTDGPMSPIPLPVHVGMRKPVREAADDAPTSVLHTMLARHQRHSPIDDPEFDWAGHDLEPRWLGMESSDCVAALDPSIYHRRGDAELVAHADLDELEANYAERRQELQDRLKAAKAQAEPVRHRLLYGTGLELEQAVAAVLAAAGFTVVRVDELLGDTASADLLVAHEGERRLIEVKSASGSASETLVGQLERHLLTWPQLRPEDPVGGGVLVVNHEHRLEPGERGRAVYTRPEHVAALSVPIIATRALFDWWRAEDWTGVRDAIFGSDRDGSEHPAAGGLPSAAARLQEAPASDRRSRKLLTRLGRGRGTGGPDGSG